MKTQQKVLVVGATGGSGLATVQRLLDQGHTVTAFSRSARSLATLSPDLKIVEGDARSASDLNRAIAGQDAVIVTLGIAENPLWVRLFGTRRTAPNIRSAGTAQVIESMRHHGVRRLVVMTSFGLRESYASLRLRDRLLFRLLLQPQLADTQIQQDLVYQSGLDWIIAQPVNLTNQSSNAAPHLSNSGCIRGWKVARSRVAQFLTDAISSPKFLHQSVAISG